MSEKLCERREVRLDDLIPFQLRPSSQTYQGERLEQLVSSIDRVGLMNAIIVRPIDGGKYEIICGHNRFNAMRELGRDTTLADVRDGLSDDEALELFYDSNLNQQSFSDWNYSQRINAIQYTETLIKENSQQGRRNDLVGNENEATEIETCVQSRHKSGGRSRRSTTRDRMARRLGISTATLSKYRSIVKLDDAVIEALARMLDKKQITFEVAYRLSRFNDKDVKRLVEFIEEASDRKVDLVKLKELFAQRKGSSKENMIPMLAQDMMNEILMPKEWKPMKPIRNDGSSS